jgi:aspartate/methionine/tyrosine aminotransferase
VPIPLSPPRLARRCNPSRAAAALVRQVALVPGEAFGAPTTVRLSYAAKMDEIRDAVGKLGECLQALRAP